MKCLKLRGFNRLTNFFLENMLCEMYRHLDKDTWCKLKETEKNGGVLLYCVKKRFGNAMFS